MSLLPPPPPNLQRFSTERFTLRAASLNEDRCHLLAVRTQVFVHEQGVPEELEWDGKDPNCFHVIVFSTDGHPVGTARLFLFSEGEEKRQGRLGRMAVLRTHRDQGVGTAIMRAMLAYAEAADIRELVLAAQLHAVEFYRRFGFRAQGEEFLDAGLPHREMVLRFLGERSLL